MKPIIYNAMVLKEPYSGVEVTVHQLAAALAEYGTLPMEIFLPQNHRPIPQSDHVKLNHSAVTSHSRTLRILWEQLVLPLKIRVKGAGLLHSPAYVTTLVAPCPVVLTVHDLHAMTHPQFCTRSNRMHYSMLIPASINKAAAIIAFSAYTQRIIQNRFPKAAKKITVIPPGISPLFQRNENNADSQKTRHKYNLPNSFLLFVGDLTCRKNILGLISAFALLQAERADLNLILAGATDQATAAILDKEIHKHGIQHRAKRIGYVAAQNLPILYSMAEAFVFPSHDEGFGLPPLEAMACGCPVVCSGGAPVEICGQAAVTCDSRDHSSIASAVSLLLDHPQYRAEKVLAGYKKAGEFTWEKAALATEAVYKAVLCNKAED